MTQDLHNFPLFFIQFDGSILDCTDLPFKYVYNKSGHLCYGLNLSSSTIVTPYSTEYEKPILDKNFINDINQGKFDLYLGIIGLKEHIESGNYIVNISDPKECNIGRGR